MLARVDDSVLVHIDWQPKFMAPIPHVEDPFRRAIFLHRCAGLLGVPILATEQVPEKMGGTHPDLLPLGPVETFAKTAFSAFGCAEFVSRLEGLGRRQLILTGIEEHICVLQSALHARERGYDVFLVEDAIRGRLLTSAFTRMTRAGVVLSHSESIVYEWMADAAHPQFREILDVVKEFSDA